MGAEVIKVESPSHMDVIRELTMNIPGLTHNTSPYFNGYNRNKAGFGLEVETPEGLALFKRLVSVSDVMVENFRTDVSVKLGITYDDLRKVKPDIIMISMQTYGRSGPLANFPGYGPMSEYMAGLTSMSGYPGGMPQKNGISYGDPLGAVAGAGAVVAALLYRRRTGKGQYIELAMRENVIGFIGEAVLDWSMNKRLRNRQGNRNDHFAPQGCYACAGDDQWITIAVETDDQWRGLCQAMGIPRLADDPRFATVPQRLLHHDELDRMIGAWAAELPREQVFSTLLSHGVPVGKILNAKDLLEDPHLKERGFYQPITHAEAGTWPLDMPVWKMSKTPGKFWRAAPRFGEHNDYVLREVLGLSHEEAEALKARGVVGDNPRRVGS
jgi:benzylsuccinate CoA-transferase BbsF subunit